MHKHSRNSLSLSGVRKFTVKQGLDWLRCGWRAFEKNPQLWMTICSIYSLCILGFAQIPVMGTFVVALFLPILTGGIYLTFERLIVESRNTTDQNSKKKGKDKKEQLGWLVFEAMRGLLSVFSHDHKIISTLQLCFVAAVLTFLGQSIVHLLAAPMFLENVQASQMSAYQISMFVVATITIIAFYMISIILFVYCIPLCLIRDEPIFESVYYSFAAVWKNLGAVTVFILILSLPIAIAFFSVASNRVEGLILAGVIGVFVLPLIIGSMYCSYRLMYR
ncbi:hypothetical protein ACFL17_07105 [Pseudomonadota bacterium]